MTRKQSAKTEVAAQPKDKLLTKMTLFFFARQRTTALLWLIIAVFGVLSYTTLLKREGFPSTNIPLVIVNATYAASDPAVVDRELAQPLSAVALKQPGVKSVQTQSAANFTSITVQYEESAVSTEKAELLKKAVAASNVPKDARIDYKAPFFGATGPDIDKTDVAVSFYSKEDDKDIAVLVSQAEAAARALQAKNIPLVEKVFVKSPYREIPNPATGELTSVQASFDRYGERHTDDAHFHDSVIIGFTAKNKVDLIKLDDQVRAALDDVLASQQFAGYEARVSASFAPAIKDNISELQRVLLEGLLVVLIVGSLVIAVRASLITVVSMVTVIVATIGLLYLFGYSLNVITLFALILGLSLVVDDTIIMVEAIDAARRKQKTARAAVEVATRKVSRAMVAATLTAALSFAPLAFVGGVLGGFIRAIPVTIIASLLISLFVALVFIPLFSRYVLLGKKQMGEQGVKEIGAAFEHRIAHAISRPMLWARDSRRKLFGVGLTAVFIGLGFIFAGGMIAQKVTFNIFPPTKDTNGLMLTFEYPEGTTVSQAEEIADAADALIANKLGDNFEYASYYNSGTANGGMLYTELISYTKRDVTSQQLVSQLQQTFDNEFKQARVSVAQSDVGPPSAAFTIKLDAKDRTAAFKAADDIAAYLNTQPLRRVNGETARIKTVTVSSKSQYTRSDNQPRVAVNATFADTDTTTLVNLAQEALKKEFNSTKLASYGLPADALQFDLGQESENQDSFKSLAVAFPLVLLAIYLLLAVQFRSLLQPLLIFMAIPFSIFGVMLGLYLTDNAISFFAMLGFFALIGLSIKNTILLTDFANQSRKAGLGAIDAAVAALGERFRPLVATSLTAVVSLIPLAITSPFWQGLAVVLIFGLLSSTILVITVFPYYYLGGEYLRRHVSRVQGIVWLIALILVTGLLVRGGVGFGIAFLAALLIATLSAKLLAGVQNRRSA